MCIVALYPEEHAELGQLGDDGERIGGEAGARAQREAAQRLLPLAAERGIAFIANRPFRRGALVDRAKRHPLPPWAGEIDCADWAALLLKFIVSHPAVTCAIPATSRVDHMSENMRAMRAATC